MADGQGTFGGGGSVHWQVDFNDGDPPQVTQKPRPRGYVVKGVDKHSTPDTDKTNRYFVMHVRATGPGPVKCIPDGSGGMLVYAAVDAREAQGADQVAIGWAFKENEIKDDAAALLALLGRQAAGV